MMILPAHILPAGLMNASEKNGHRPFFFNKLRHQDVTAALPPEFVGGGTM